MLLFTQKWCKYPYLPSFRSKEKLFFCFTKWFYRDIIARCLAMALGVSLNAALP